MKNRYNNIITSRWLRSCIFLALVYSSQAYSLYHSIHSHEESAKEFIFPAVDADEEHSSDHHHHIAHEQSDDHQHTYDKHIDWLFTRTQSQRTVTIYDQYIFSSIPQIIIDDGISSYFALEGLVLIDEYHDSSSVIRGPPLFG